MLPKFSILFSFFIVSSLTLSCPDGFTVLNNNACYQYIERLATYSNASVHCKQLGGSLISIQSWVDNNEIAVHIASNPFIGLQCDSSSSYNCTWEDGSAFDYTNFYFPYRIDNGDCVTLEAGSGDWYSTPCDIPRSYVCEVKQQQQTCQFSYQGYCYNPHTIALSESDAEAVCQQECGHLVSIHSSDENLFVRSLFDANTYNYIRIGALYQNNINSWTDVSSWNYQNIGYQNVNFGSCYSMALTNDVVAAGKWISSQCSKALPFVCKKKSSAQCGPTPPPTLAPIQCNSPQFLDTEGYIYSPGYPLEYSSGNQSCTYILSTPLGTTVMLEFTDFWIDASSTIALYNSIEDEDPFAVFDCWNQPNNTYTSTSNTMKFVFHARSSNFFDNSTTLWSAFFNSSSPIQLTTTPSIIQTTTKPPASACGPLSYYVPPATINYPDVTGSLPTDYKCVYSISAGYGNRIKVSFNYVNLYNGGSVVVYDGASTASPILVTMQNGPSGWYNSTSNHMLLYLTLSSGYDNFSADVRTIS